MKEAHLWEFILTSLNKNESVILTVVVNNSKGSPGKQGFKMAVSSEGDFAGSIGGGVMEYDLIRHCKETFRKGEFVNKIETLHHKRMSSVMKSGLICSGSQTNFSFTLGKKNVADVRKIFNAVKENKSGAIVFNNKGIEYLQTLRKIKEKRFKYRNEKVWEYVEPTDKRNIVYIIGGGHVGLAVCKILSLLDFYVTVYDSRKDLAMMRENNFADKIITRPFAELGKMIEPGSYVVIVTTGFESDKEALEQVINNNAKYIGLMGTKSKIRKIFNEALKDGIRKEDLNKIKAPIGIDIKSGTPEEIAVSITAEIIKIKNSKA
jgi:xanthine dehydrogenase accessory factor